jgi:hypothetical protein
MYLLRETVRAREPMASAHIWGGGGAAYMLQGPLGRKGCVGKLQEGLLGHGALGHPRLAGIHVHQGQRRCHLRNHPRTETAHGHRDGTIRGGVGACERLHLHTQRQGRAGATPTYTRTVKRETHTPYTPYAHTPNTRKHTPHTRHTHTRASTRGPVPRAHLGGSEGSGRPRLKVEQRL